MAVLSTAFWILGFLCAFWVIYDVFTKNRRVSTELKVVWTICAILFSIITAIVYYFVYKSR